MSFLVGLPVHKAVQIIELWSVYSMYKVSEASVVVEIFLSFI